MHLEKDYTKLENRETLSEERIKGIINEDNKLALYLRYFYLWESQFMRVYSKTKKDKIFYFFEQLKNLAFIHNGKVTLDINEEKMNARLVYWGDGIVVLPKELDISKNILLSLLRDFDIVSINSVNGGIEIRIEEDFYESVEIRDEQATLSELKEIINSHRTYKDIL